MITSQELANIFINLSKEQKVWCAKNVAPTTLKRWCAQHKNKVCKLSEKIKIHMNGEELSDLAKIEKQEYESK